MGYAELRTATAPASVPGRLPIELGGIFVAPDWSGHGVGSTLIDAASKLALSLGYRSLWVRVLAANQAAVSFLGSLRFARVHRDLLVGQKSAATVLTLSRDLTSLESQSR